MKIGELNQHCGKCEIIEFCGNSFGYCICNKKCFKNIDTDIYKKYAEKAVTTAFAFCEKCLSEDDCGKCEHEDEARDYYCEQVAEYVASMCID